MNIIAIVLNLQCVCFFWLLYFFAGFFALTQINLLNCLSNAITTDTRLLLALESACTYRVSDSFTSSLDAAIGRGWEQNKPKKAVEIVI